MYSAEGKNRTSTDALKSHEEIDEGILHAEGTCGRIILFRLKPGIDMVDGIKQVCKHYRVKAGVITSIFGSLQKVKLMVPMEGLSFPVAKDHIPRTIEKEQVNLASGCGFVNTLEDGEIAIHLHVMVFDGGLGGPAPEFPSIGGHVDCDAPAPCFGCIEVAIQEVKGVELVRKVDADVLLPVTFPIKCRSDR